MEISAIVQMLEDHRKKVDEIEKRIKKALIEVIKLDIMLESEINGGKLIIDRDKFDSIIKIFFIMR